MPSMLCNYTIYVVQAKIDSRYYQIEQKKLLQATQKQSPSQSLLFLAIMQYFAGLPYQPDNSYENSYKQ